MVTKNDCMIPQCGQMPDFGAAKLIVGAKQLKKAILSGTARHVYLAQDADPAVTGLEKNRGLSYGKPTVFRGQLHS